jgi:hypothetical protein
VFVCIHFATTELNKSHTAMKVTLLALNLLAAAATASMAEDFVSNLNASATNTSNSAQNEPKDGQRRRVKKVLRGTAKSEHDTVNERKLKDNKDDKDDKGDKDDDEKTYQGSNSYGLNYFVPSYPGKAHKSDGEFDLGYNVRPDNKHTRPLTHGDREDKTPSYSKDKKGSYVKPEKKEDYHSKLNYVGKEKAEEVNVMFTEETDGSTDTLEPTIATAYPTVSPTWSPSLSPSDARESRVSVETGAPTFDETADPTNQPTLQPTLPPSLQVTVVTASPTFDELTGSPTFDESTDPTLKPTALLTGSPTFDETSEPTVAAVDEETSTLSTVEIITTTGWQPDETSNVTWNYNGKPERTRPPSTTEPTPFVSTAAPSMKDSSVSPTLSPSIATNDPTRTTSSDTAVSTDAPVSTSESINATSTKSPSYYPTYFPTTSNTPSPTFYEGSTTATATEASPSASNETAPGGFDCTAEFCEYQLSDAYFMEYRLNIPEGETVDECQTCSLSVRLTYEGEAWLGFAFSNDGQMVGSEAVM